MRVTKHELSKVMVLSADSYIIYHDIMYIYIYIWYPPKTYASVDFVGICDTFDEF